MEDDASVRTVTLFLSGGHQIRLGGAVDVVSLVERLRSNDTQIIEVSSETGDRLSGEVEQFGDRARLHA